MVKKKDTEQNTAEKAKTYEFVPKEEAKQTAPIEENLEALQAQHLRLQADFDNFKKRNSAVSFKRYNDGVEDVIRNMLPTLDYLEMAILAQKDESQRKGIELVKRTFLEVLDKYDCKEIEVLDKEFDPNLAEAMMNKDDSDNAGKVIEVIKKGYIRNDIILRHAMVVVAQ